MKINIQSPLQVLLFILVLIFQFSCSKDSDLLAEYVISETQKAILIDDIFVVSLNGSTVLDVLANDTFENEEEVVITETSTPTNGTVEINSDNTLTYTPETTEETEDTFTYTTEVVNPDETVSTETSNVTVTLTEDSNKNIGELLAFPGAVGFGKNATGGRGGIVVEVTNLNDSGSGSLREALKIKGSRTIVFKVAGNINLDSYLYVGPENGDLTIAGQTAPGGGICIKNHGIRLEGSNTIIRYVRFRPGDLADSGEDAVTIVARSGRTVQNVILDHCSISWGKDENLNIGSIGGAGVNNVTIQNSIIAENIDTGYGVLLWNKATNISFYQNLLAHNKARNIRSSTCTSDFEFVNNVVYSFNTACSPTYENRFDMVGNVFLSNPNVNISQSIVKLEASTNNCPDGKASLTQAYLSDNTFDKSDITVENELNSYLMGSKIFNSGNEAIPNNQVKDIVLAEAGANLFRDSSDARIISDVINLTGGIPKTVSQAGGYPVLTNGTAFTDIDKDGMNDSWESSNGLNPNDPSDRSTADSNGNGYTNLEVYLHYLTTLQ